MEFSINPDALSAPLQAVSGAVEKKQTLPIMGNVLLTLEADRLSLTATDAQIELSAQTTDLNEVKNTGKTTVSARKLMDICRTLPPNATLHCQQKDHKLFIRAGHSRFALSTLPAEDFPKFEDQPTTQTLTLPEHVLHTLIEKTHFSMAQHDVRYYFNGVFFDINTNHLQTVATDGHRLAACALPYQDNTLPLAQLIVPRKSISELLRLLSNEAHPVEMSTSENHLNIKAKDFSFSSVLIDGKFPNYRAVIPENSSETAYADVQTLREALNRVNILSHDKNKGARFIFSENLLTISSYNAEKETAEEQIHIDYQGTTLDIGINIKYLQDILQAISTQAVAIKLTDENNSILIEPQDNTAPYHPLYVLMPMKL